MIKASLVIFKFHQINSLPPFTKTKEIYLPLIFRNQQEVFFPFFKNKNRDFRGCGVLQKKFHQFLSLMSPSHLMIFLFGSMFYMNCLKIHRLHFTMTPNLLHRTIVSECPPSFITNTKWLEIIFAFFAQVYSINLWEVFCKCWNKNAVYTLPF